MSVPGQPPGSMPRVVRLRAELNDAALGIGAPAPRLSWMTATLAPNWVQAAYKIEVLDDAGRPLWSSGRVESGDQVLVPWGGEPLRSRERCSARVRGWGLRRR